MIPSSSVSACPLFVGDVPEVDSTRTLSPSWKSSLALEIVWMVGLLTTDASFSFATFARVMGGDAKKLLSKSQIGHKNLESHISINKCVFGIFHDTIVLRFFLAIH